MIKSVSISKKNRVKIPTKKISAKFVLNFFKKNHQNQNILEKIKEKIVKSFIATGFKLPNFYKFNKKIKVK